MSAVNSISCSDCGMAFNGHGDKAALKLHKRDVHQQQVKVVFAENSRELVLDRDTHGLFHCPLEACPLSTNKPATIQGHCRKRVYQLSSGNMGGECYS